MINKKEIFNKALKEVKVIPNTIAEIILCDKVIELTEKEIICKTCGFPKEWIREPVLLDCNPVSFMGAQENTCKECGHQKDGYTIYKIQPLLRKFREAGKEEIKEELLQEFLNIIENAKGKRNAVIREMDVGEYDKFISAWYLKDKLSKLQLKEKGETHETSKINNL